MPADPKYRMEYLSSWMGAEPGDTYAIAVNLVGLSQVVGYCEAWNFDQNNLRSYAFHKIVRLVDLHDGHTFEDAGQALCEQLGGEMLLPQDHYRYPLEAVGASYYDDALRTIVGEIRGATAEHRCQAELRPYDTNEHDPMAVAVVVAGRTVAHLDRHEARTHREALAARGIPGARTVCAALIVGRGIVDGQTRAFSVLLDPLSSRDSF